MANGTPQDEEFDKQHNIVAFCSDPNSLQMMTATLNSLNIQACVAYGGDMKVALEYLVKHRTPKIVIADISNSDLPLSDVRNLLEVCEPGTYVVILGTRNDVGLFRDLLRLGITDYIVKPLGLDFMSRSLLNIIQGTGSDYSDARVGKVMTFLGARGGVGTSTLASNIGWLLAHEKFKRTLIFDLDLHHGSTGLFLDIKPQNHLHDLLDNIDNLDETILEISFQKHSERLLLLTHQQELEKDYHCPIESLEKLLPVLRDRFHYLIIDLPRAMNDVTRMMLKYTSNIFVVADPSLASVRDTMRLLELIGTERANTKASVILNKVGQFSRGEITPAAFAKSINHPVNFTVPHDATHPLIAANMGKPLASFPSPLGTHLRTITDHISGTLQIEAQKTWSEEFLSSVQEWIGQSSDINAFSWGDKIRALLGGRSPQEAPKNLPTPHPEPSVKA